MKKIIFILLGIGFINMLYAQDNEFDKWKQNFDNLEYIYDNYEEQNYFSTNEFITNSNLFENYDNVKKYRNLHKIYDYLFLHMLHAIVGSENAVKYLYEARDEYNNLSTYDIMKFNEAIFSSDGDKSYELINDLILKFENNALNFWLYRI